MAQETPRVLYPLSESDKIVEDPSADVRGRSVVDRNGEEVGRVDDLLIDDEETRVVFLRVSEGGFLGLGKTHYLVPVEAVVAVDRDRVHIDRHRSGMGEVPAYEPKLATAPEYYGNVYGWWGVPPYWGPGYR